MIKAVLLDFDGTLVTEDILEILAGREGKGAQSRQLLDDFHTGKLKGLAGLVERINLLTGVSLSDLASVLERDNFLMPGARELTDFLHDNGIVSIVASGSILPVLEYYQHNFLHLDYVIGSPVRVRDGVLGGISTQDYSHPDFKLFESQKILEALGVTASQIVAIGDSPGDKSRFEFAAHAIAINPKEGIEQYADHVIHGDLTEAISIIKRYNGA